MRNWILSLLLLACVGCGPMNQGYVLKKVYRPSGTKLSLIPKLFVEDEEVAFWIYLKVREKPQSYVLILENDNGMRVPFSVDREFYYQVNQGQYVKLVGVRNNILYLELLKENTRRNCCE